MMWKMIQYQEFSLGYIKSSVSCWYLGGGILSISSNIHAAET